MQTTTLQTFRGTIQWLISPDRYDSDKSLRYRVISLKLDDPIDGRTTMTIAGTFGFYAVGSYVEGQGVKEGSSIKAQTLKRCEAGEKGAREMLKFLFGKASADKLITGWGGDPVDCYTVLKDHPDRFFSRACGIKGIGKKKIEKALEKMESASPLEDILDRFGPYGLRLEDAKKVYEAHEKQAISRIEKDPWQALSGLLAWPLIDRIAFEGMELSPSDPRRLRKGLPYALHAYMQRTGSTCCWQEEFLFIAAKELGVDVCLISEALIGLLEDGVLKREWNKLFLPAYFDAEKKIAFTAKRSRRIPVQERFLLQHISSYETAAGWKLNDDQKKAVKMALTNSFSILTGCPGSGKSTVLDCICKGYEALHSSEAKIILAAPTGKAAKRITESTGRPASTIHRLLGWDMTRKEGAFIHNELNTIEADLLIIDEVSMMGCLLAADLFKALPSSCSVLLVGDADQLPSVEPGNVLHDLLGIAEVERTALTQVYRQGADSTILKRAQAVSSGKNPDLIPASDFEFYEADHDPDSTAPELIELYKELVEENGVDNLLFLSPMNKGVLGTKNLNRLAQEALNGYRSPIRQSRFRYGDKVIQLQNDAEREVYNGMTGYITSFEEGKSFSDDILTISFGEEQEVGYKRSQWDQLDLAYCTTIHKAQGSEANTVLLLADFSHEVMMKRRLLYTGMTRAKKKLVVVGAPEMIAKAALTEEETACTTTKFHYYA